MPMAARNDSPSPAIGFGLLLTRQGNRHRPSAVRRKIPVREVANELE